MEPPGAMAVEPKLPTEKAAPVLVGALSAMSNSSVPILLIVIVLTNGVPVVVVPMS